MVYLIVEDEPLEKLGKFVDYLELQEDLEYEIIGNEKDAKKYLTNNGSKIDLIITDLGLPKQEGSEEYNIYSGIEVVDDFKVRNRRIPVLINSATELDDKSKKRLSGIDYRQVTNLAELDEMHFISILKEMKDKSLKVDETKAIKSGKGKTGFMANGRFYYSHDGD